MLIMRESQRATLVERDTKGDKGPAESSARACGKYSKWESVACGSPLARGPMATLEPVSMGK